MAGLGFLRSVLRRLGCATRARYHDSIRAAANWRALVKHAFRIRRLQRIWHNVGMLLQGINADLRLRLRQVDPPPSGPPAR